jgi:drug/metabolite transporter (DMT)-like permease
MLLSLKSIGLFGAAMALDTLGNILFKKGMNHFSASTIPGWKGYWITIKQALSSRDVTLGSIAMVLEAIVWLFFLSITPLNIAAPLSSANNVFILLASAWFLKERVSKKRWLGVVLIITGMIFVCGDYI